MKPKAIDLFSGVGGLSLGFENAGFNIDLAIEYDKLIAEAYCKNRQNPQMIVSDITKLPLQDTFLKYKNKIDIVIGGPPCQGFSQKGQRKTLFDERNFLFKYFYEVVNIIKPPFFLMENVPNIITSEQGYFQNEIHNIFSSLGYKITSMVLNSSDFGVPQDRRRAFFIGKKGDSIIDLDELNSQRFSDVTVWDAISDLSYLESGEGSEIQNYKFEANTPYQKQLRKNSTYLYNHIATKHSDITIQRLNIIPQNGGRRDLPEEHLTKSIYSGTWTRMKKNEKSVTITTRFDTPSSGKFTHPILNRAITVREAARIQSFPDSFRFFGSKSSQMKQVGNSVPPILAEALACFVLKHF